MCRNEFTIPFKNVCPFVNIIKDIRCMQRLLFILCTDVRKISVGECKRAVKDCSIHYLFDFTIDMCIIDIFSY